MAFQICETRTCGRVSIAWVYDELIAYLGLVLDLHVASSQQLRVDALRQALEDVPPRCPDRKAEYEGACDTENRVPDDIPKEGVEEEQDEVHDVHDR